MDQSGRNARGRQLHGTLEASVADLVDSDEWRKMLGTTDRRMGSDMNALTVRQPWASLIICGLKGCREPSLDATSNADRATLRDSPRTAS
jgi:hypothetical protein